MVSFGGSCLLLDIEGTTSSVSFVYDEMFPLVRRQLAEFLRNQWHRADVQEACRLIAIDAEWESVDGWGAEATDGAARGMVEREVLRQMDADLKATGLKRLQGLIWRGAFESGQLRAHLYDDVPDAMRRWVSAGRTISIYSSGSVEAQRLFFGHTIFGDLRPLIRGYYDTTIGGKRASESYRRIVADIDRAADDILFASDVVEELDAAESAGLQTVLCQRPGNAPVSPEHAHAQITSFAQIELVER